MKTPFKLSVEVQRLIASHEGQSNAQGYIQTYGEKYGPWLLELDRARSRWLYAAQDGDTFQLPPELD